MPCKKIQEVLATDYLDGLSGSKEQQRINEHLARCPECRGLAKELQSQRQLFQKVEREDVPERVWQNIQEAIVKQELSTQNKSASSVFERVRTGLFPSRPVFAFASALTVMVFALFFTGSVIQRSQGLKNNKTELFAVYGLGAEKEQALLDLGTNVEQYFL